MVELSNLDKAAVILLSLEKEDAASVMKEMTFQEVEKVSLAMYNLRDLQIEERRKVVESFVDKVCNLDNVIGNRVATKHILSAFLTKEEMSNLSSKLVQKEDIWEALHLIDSEVLALYLAREKTATTTIILSQMRHDKVASVLGFMDNTYATEIINAMATLDDIHPVVIKEIEKVLKKDLTNSMKFCSNSITKTARRIASVISGIKADKRKTYMNLLHEKHPDLHDVVDNLLFTFEDIKTLDPMSMQKVVQKVNQETLSLALKNASEDVKKIFFGNMSKRMCDVIKIEWEEMGRVKKSDVANAQAKIVSTVKDLLASGEISELDEDYI